MRLCLKNTLCYRREQNLGRTAGSHFRRDIRLWRKQRGHWQCNSPGLNTELHSRMYRFDTRLCEKGKRFLGCRERPATWARGAFGSTPIAQWEVAGSNPALPSTGPLGCGAGLSYFDKLRHVKAAPQGDMAAPVQFGLWNIYGSAECGRSLAGCEQETSVRFRPLPPPAPGDMGAGTSYFNMVQSRQAACVRAGPGGSGP